MPTCGADSDSDGEGLGNGCDPCPTIVDCDGDGWTDWQELGFITTDPITPCLSNGWPPDPAPGSDGNGIMEIDDLFFATSRYQASIGDPNYSPRAEIVSQDGSIGLDDVLAFASPYGRSCLVE